MDINQCIDKLGLNANTYRLDKSDPPHKFIEWTGGDPQPSNTVLETAWAEIEANRKATQYSRDRKEEYDKLNQFELIGEDSINGTTNHKDAILAIKIKYPKE